MDTNQSLAHAVRAFANSRLLIIGDIMLDCYTIGNANRVSPEAPVLILSGSDVDHRLGGAASVALLAKSFGAEVSLAGVIGSNASGKILQQELEASGINSTNVIVDNNRKTTVKHRFIGKAGGRHPQQMLRVDLEDRHAVSESQVEKLLGGLASGHHPVDAILISDYAKGVCTPELIKRVILHARDRQVPVIADPGNGIDLGSYRGCTAITPNRSETEVALERTIVDPEDALNAANELRSRLDLQAVLLTLDKQGIALTTLDGVSEVVPTKARRVYDVTGAGDMVLAMAGLCRAIQLNWHSTTQLANIAASIEIQKMGVATVTPEEVLAQIPTSAKYNAAPVKSISEIQELLVQHRKAGARIAFTNGCFDILHLGHLRYLVEASDFADVLIVGINSDRSVRALKGKDRPVVPENERAELVGGLRCVDAVVIFDQLDPGALIEKIRPDVLVKGGDYNVDNIIGREFVESYGGSVMTTRFIEGLSSSRIIERLRSANDSIG